MSRERQLLKPVEIKLLNVDGIEIADGNEIFVNEDLQALWNQALHQDTTYRKIALAVREGERTWPKETKVPIEGSEELKPLKVMITACSFDQEKGVLKYQGRIWTPLYEPLATAIIQSIHDATVSAHPGRDATLAQVARNYFWPRISKAVKRFCKNCHVCRRSSTWLHQKQGLLKPLPVPGRFHQELPIDFMVDLPEIQGNTSIMVITDRLLKPVTLEAIDVTADKLNIPVIRIMGICPVADKNGVNFIR